MQNKISSHRDLKVWQEAMLLVEMIYELAKNLPLDEKYGLSAQLKRCAVSVPSNIAEGFGRKGSKELIQFLYHALGSLAEMETQIEIAVRLGFIKSIIAEEEKIKFTRILLTKLISSIKNKSGEQDSMK